jgi:Bifunctional DNA primase/polymerase, N-terminal
MSFLSIVTPFVALGIPVFPLTPKTKIPPSGFHFLEEATIDPAKVASWNDENPDYNVALLANGEFCFLEFDVAKGMSTAAAEMGHEIPQTRTQVSGKGFGHYIFKHTERSRALGNRSVNLPEGGEWFSFRAGNKYLVGAGSLHPNGSYYQNARDIEPILMPDWLCDFVEKHSTPTKPKACDNAVEVADDFDFEDMVDFYGIGIAGEKDDVWQVVEECPGVGYRHAGSTLTAFYWDGSSLGWSCFAQECPLHGKSIGEVIAFLNAKNGSPYRGIIWEKHEDDLLDPKWDVEIVDDEEPRDVAPEAVHESSSAVAVTSKPDNYTDGLDEFIKEQKLNGEIAWTPEDFQSEPDSIAITDPEKHEGLEFPGDCAMYGRLAAIAKRRERLQLGWLYPSLLIVASCLDIEDADHHVRANEYGALIGGVHTGKNAHMDVALASIRIPDREAVVMEDAPGSHSGLMNQLSEDEPVPRLLFLDELINVFNACAIQGSNLPAMLCSLWNKDKVGGSVKKGRQVVYGKLSMLGGLAINDAADFSRVFGAHSVKGLYDRFIFGYSEKHLKFRPTKIEPEFFDPKPVHFPQWVWNAKDEWIGDDLARGRLSEHALRIALITAACNGDAEITKPCLEAAFRFCEWQERLRQVFKPGLAETKDAEAFEAVWSALREQYNRQKKSGETHPKAASLSIDMGQENRWKLIHFTDVLNSKSYYRRYARFISQVRKTLLEEGFIHEIREDEEDERGKVKKGKTPFVVLAKEVR